MHKLKQYIPIIFNGGSYGSFLQYALLNLSIGHIITNPFTSHGASHKWVCNVLTTNNDGEFIIDQQADNQFIKYHPKTNKNDLLVDRILSAVNASNKAVFVYPTKETEMLLTCNNMYFKIWGEEWFENELLYAPLEKEIFNNNLYSNWDIPPNTKFKDINRWIQREFLSFYYFTACESLYEWDTEITSLVKHPNLHVVSVNDLLYNFEDTIVKLADFCEIEHTNLPNVLKLHSRMISLQEHISKDVICHNIIDAFFNDSFYEFNSLSVVDEAWIQKKLRENGYEIQCDKLDIFPTNTLDLKKITVQT